MMDHIGIHQQKFTADQRMTLFPEKNLAGAVQGVVQFQRRMPVGRRIFSSLGIIMDADPGLVQIINLFIYNIVHLLFSRFFLLFR